ncbi:MAG: MiaB/RimO family radical SAM methylthiotransferase [Terracidiphilus sp.]|jgi:threonylcarbamoyladenosine tRNA methylthiotransferase MtaB
MAFSFHVEHFGCRAARADGEAVSDRLRVAGLREGEPSAADVVVVNTCSVTAEADRAARAFIRRAHRVNPAARIVVTGCYAQRAPEELAGMAGVAAVVGNSHKALAPEIALGLARERAGSASVPLPELVSVQSLAAGGAQPFAPIWADDRFAHSFLEEAQIVPGTQTRPNLKIQEGCGNRCAFCVIPRTRGSSRSLAAAAVLKQVEGFVAAGGKELVLSGINLGRWGRDLAGDPYERTDRDSRYPTLSAKERGKDGAPSLFGAPGSVRSLAGLVRRILERTGLPRLRLSSIEPMDWDAELIELMAEFGGTRLARHAHLPLQSGSDAVLRRMHRRYRPWHYVEKVKALERAAGPELTLGADVMVGFPGETDGEFAETLELVRALPFGYLHLFPFSPRPGTRGWALHAERPVRAAVVEERIALLRTLALEKSQTHRRCLVGREVEAITLNTPPEMEARGWTAALTENFLPVELEGRLEANRLARVRVSGLTAEGTLKATNSSPS